MAEFSPLQRGRAGQQLVLTTASGLGPNTCPMDRTIPGGRGQGWLDQAHSPRSPTVTHRWAGSWLRGPPTGFPASAARAGRGVGLGRAARVKNRMGSLRKPPFLVTEGTGEPPEGPGLPGVLLGRRPHWVSLSSAQENVRHERYLRKKGLFFCPKEKNLTCV